jgi:TPR repeat protein
MSRVIGLVAAGVGLLGLTVFSGACGPRRPINGPGPGGVGGGGPSTEVVSTYAEPLIVDWSSDHRTDLEVLTRDRIAVVRYQKNAIKMLKDCTLEGNYGYVGVTKKEDIIRYDSMDEVAANLPGIFALGGAKLGADMQSGTTIDIGLVIVGKRTAVRTSAERAELKGECEGATHFVRGATIGAFAVQTGERSKVGTVAGIFGAEASYKTSSSKLVSKKDGSLDSCKGSSTEAPKAPEGCGSLLRLELRPFDAPKIAAKDSAGKPIAASEIPECGDGLVWDGRKCASKVTTKSFACSGKDEAQCRAQCDKSNAKSCTQLAVLYRNAGKDQIQAVAFFKKACGLGDESACAELGSHLLHGIGVQADRFRAFETFQKACTAGDGLGCSFLGGMHRSGTAPDSKVEQAFSLFKRACSGGLSQGCVELGVMYEQGVATPRDYKKAVEQYQRACRADNQDGCAHMGILYSSDRKGVGLDRAKAMDYFRAACERNSALGCTELGNTYFRGAGLERDKQGDNDKEAARLYEKACSLWGGAEGCARLGYLMMYGYGVKKDSYAGVAKIEKGCNEGSGYACVELGKVYTSGRLRARDPVKAFEYYEKACNLFEGEGCRLIGLLYRNGDGVAKDDRRAHGFFERGCRTGHPRACYDVGQDLYWGRTGVSPDHKKAFAHFEHSCSGGYADSCNDVGALYAMGKGVPKDEQKAAQLYEMGCEAGSAKACDNLGLFIEKGIYKASAKERALELFGQACDKGDSAACYRLASRFRATRDVMKAVQYYRKGCDKSHGQSCLEVAGMYRSGYSGMAQDHREAMKYYDKACWRRMESACEAKADMYAEGQGVPKNPAMAAKLRLESCNRGSTRSCRGLAQMYKEGVGVPKKDLEEAAKLHEKACYLRSNQDCYELAMAHDKGDGVKKDPKLVAKFFQRACSFGNTEACSNLGYFIFKGANDYTKDPTLGVSRLRYGCQNFSWRWKEEKDKVKNVWACGALKRLNQKLKGPETPGGASPPMGGYGLGGTQKM